MATAPLRGGSRAMATAPGAGNGATMAAGPQRGSLMETTAPAPRSSSSSSSRGKSLQQPLEGHVPPPPQAPSLHPRGLRGGILPPPPSRTAPPGHAGAHTCASSVPTQGPHPVPHAPPEKQHLNPAVKIKTFIKHKKMTTWGGAPAHGGRTRPPQGSRGLGGIGRGEHAAGVGPHPGVLEHSAQRQALSRDVPQQLANEVAGTLGHGRREAQVHLWEHTWGRCHLRVAPHPQRRGAAGSGVRDTHGPGPQHQCCHPGGWA